MYTNVHALVLRVQRVGEYDKRLSLFTREEGRLTAVAKGACRPRSRLSFASEPAVEAQFRLWTGNPSATTARITGGALITAFPGLRDGWSRQTTALFFCEWMDRLTPFRQPHADKYDLLRSTLLALARIDDRSEGGEEIVGESQLGNREKTVRSAFLIQFLEKAGYSFENQVAGTLVGSEQWALVNRLRFWDFKKPVSEIDPVTASLLEDRILKFVMPLLSRPLKTLDHLRRLEDYRDRSINPPTALLTSVL